MKRICIPSTHILHSIRNKNITAAIAIAELIDNSFATASEFTLVIHPNYISVFDNGSGVSDLDDMFGLAWSKNQHDSKNIGQFGIGSKDAQLFFGSRCQVQTVYRDQYSVAFIDWTKVEQSDEWAYDVYEYPLEQSPKYIRKGGTIITITNLEQRRYHLDMLIKRLTQRFRPALLQNCKIRIYDYRDLRTGRVLKLPRMYELDQSLSVVGLTEELKVVDNLEVAGRRFSVAYGTLQEADEQLSGVHFAFGKAFPFSKRNLTTGRTTLPSRLYAEVTLSEDWKDCFAPNKEKIARFEYELEEIVASVLDPLVKELQVQTEDIRIRNVNLALTVQFENIITLKSGEHGVGERIKDDHPHNMGHASHKPKDKGEYATTQRKLRCGGIKFARNDKLGEHITSVALYEKNQLTIELNGSIPKIDWAYQQSAYVTMLWDIIAREFANFCRKNIKDIDSILPHFIDNLNNLGYGLEIDYPDLFADKIYTYIMKQCPIKIRQENVA